MTDLQKRPSDDRQATALPADLNVRELARWSWRQLTSMRTALVLLLLLALAAIPGSVIPQENIDSLEGHAVARQTTRRLAPIWDRLDLFSVYGSVWFSAIYILLMISLVGCIIPRLFVYARALRAQPAQGAAPPPAAAGVARRTPATRTPRRSCAWRTTCCAAGGSGSTGSRDPTPSPPRRATSARPATWSSTSP